MERWLLKNMTDVKKLADALSRCEQVTRYDDESEEEAWTLAHAFSDIEESLTRIYAEKLPQLMRVSDNPTAINDILLEIGEELRHVLYHIADPKFYRYLQGASSVVTDITRE